MLHCWVATRLSCSLLFVQWLNGSEPPAYREVGPYAFKGSEMRYNVSFNEDWSEVR